MLFLRTVIDEDDDDAKVTTNQTKDRKTSRNDRRSSSFARLFFAFECVYFMWQKAKPKGVILRCKTEEFWQTREQANFLLRKKVMQKWINIQRGYIYF